MPLNRKYQKIFGKNAVGTDLGVVGSKSNSNPQYSTDVEVLQSLANWETGLRAMIANNAPYLQDQNSIFYVITSQLAYLFQAGIAEWNSQTEYVANRSIVLKNGKIYIAITDNTNIEPEVTAGWATYWKTLNNWGSVIGNIYNQTDLWKAILNGIGYDSSVATALTGYSLGDILNYNDKYGNTYKIKSLKQNNQTEPDEDSNIYYPKRLLIVEGISANLPIASVDYNDKFYFETTNHTLNFCYYDSNTNQYEWIDISSDTSYTNKTITTKKKQEFYVYSTPQWINANTMYSWIYSDIRTILYRYKSTSDGNWYNLWSDCYIEQGGKANSISGGSATSVTFVIEMEDNTYDVYGGVVPNSSTVGGRFVAKERTTTGMKIDWTSDSAVDGTWWKIEGYKK